MNEQNVDVRPEVQAFVEEVRAGMSDLDPDECQELTAGLEADLSELVAEHGPDALGDPGDYTRELRLAAGHPPAMGRLPRERRVRAAVMEALDAAHAHWDRLLDSMPGGGPRSFLTAVQPVWWVVRAWVAWMVAQDARGVGFSTTGPWLAVLAVFVVVSVQLGRRAWAFDRLLDRSVLARLLLVALNVGAVAAAPGAADRAASGITEDNAWMFTEPAVATVRDDNFGVITYRGKQACVLKVFDADGHPVKGGYVWDATGNRRLPMHTRGC